MNQSLLVPFPFIPTTFNKREKTTNLFYKLKYGSIPFNSSAKGSFTSMAIIFQSVSPKIKVNLHE
jgi:hypothetical protein